MKTLFLAVMLSVAGSYCMAQAPVVADAVEENPAWNDGGDYSICLQCEYDRTHKKEVNAKVAPTKRETKKTIVKKKSENEGNTPRKQ